MLGKQIRIAISGKQRVGKNTVASLIVQQLELNNDQYKISAFADRIKETMSVMLPGVKNECLYGSSELREEPIDDSLRNEDSSLLTHRQALTDLGKLGRKYNKNLWINHLNTDFQQSKDKQLYIVSDQRFIDELSYLRDNKFFLIRVLRKGIIQGTDISETQQDNTPDSAYDWIINNDYSIEVLSNEVRRIIEAVRLKTHS